MRKQVWVSLGSIFTVAAFLLLIPTSAESPGPLAEPGIWSGKAAGVLSTASEGARTWSESSYGKLPLSFEPNQGQASEGIKFVSRGRGYTLYLTGDEAILGLRTAGPVSPAKGKDVGSDSRPSKPDALHMKLQGADQRAQTIAFDRLPGKTNYLIGKDPQKWNTNIPNYAKVRYKNVYHGIDLVYYGNQRLLEYDFVVAPGGDPKAITLEISGTEKSSPIRIAENGDLLIEAKGGEVRFHKPVVYQIESSSSQASKRQSVEGHFVLLAKNRVGFEVSTYDATKPLYIDPVISYATYLGTPDRESGEGVAVDAEGNAYVVLTASGSTADPPFPPHVLVDKINASGSAVLYSTVLGGSTYEQGSWIAVDSLGNAYVTGTTASDDFPTTENAYQKAPGGGTCSYTVGPWVVPRCTDVFFTKLNAAGSGLLYSTYLGGTNQDNTMFNGVAIDAAGNAYVAGWTQSSDFPTVNAIQPAFHGGNCGPAGATVPCPDGFVAKINPSAVGAASLVYSTFVVGSNGDEIRSVAVDSNGSAYVAGQTQSPDFPTTNGAFQTAPSGPADAFVTKINSDGSAFAYSTFLGGAGWDQAGSVGVDSEGNAYVTGMTNSADFPTTVGVDDTSCGTDGQCNGMSDTFVTKLNADGSNLVYSTFLGGSGEEAPFSIAVDSMGIAYVTGRTNSPDFPMSRITESIDGLFDSGKCGSDPNTYTCADVYVAKLTAGGENLIFSTFLGGHGDDVGNGIAVDSSRNAYVVGMTSSSDFPMMTWSLQPEFTGFADAFIVKLSDLAGSDTQPSTESIDFGEQVVGTTSEAQTVTFKNYGDAPEIVPPLDVTGDFQFTHTCGATIPPGASCTAELTFTPTETGVRTGAMRGYSEESGEWEEFLPLTGVGIAPALSVSPSNLTFEDQLVETTSKSQTVTLTNTGAVPVNFSGIQGSTHFANTHNCGTSLDPGKSCTINVTFAPKAAGLLTEQITVNHDGAGSPNSITLTGKGTDFALQSGTDGSSASVSAGETATYNLSVNAMGYSGEVRMKCQWYVAVPGGTSCSFSPSTISLDGTNPANVVLRINTTSRSMAPLLRQPLPPGPGSYPASHLVIWLLAMAAMVSLIARRRRATVALASLLFLVTLWVACGGSAPAPLAVTGTPAGTYSLSAVATTSIGPAEEYPTSVTRSTGLTLEVK